MNREAPGRTLTDADAEAIALALKAKVMSQFYTDLGKGVWGLVWRGLVMGMIGIAAWAAWHSEH
jgi:hypothetical protein